MASCQANILNRLLGRKNVRIHVEKHNGATRPNDGQDNTLPTQQVSVLAVGVSAIKDDGAVDSSTFVWGCGETHPPVVKTTEENPQVAELEAKLAEAATLAATQAAEIEDLKEKLASVDTSDKDEQIRTLTAEITEYQSVIEELEAPKTETPAPAVVSEDPAPEADVQVDADLDALSERELMSMSFD